MSPITAGLRLHDRFRLVQPLAEGGMSEVWLAVDELLDRPVAVKVLNSAMSADPLLRQATWREARAAARLAHPNAIQIYDYGEAELPRGVRVPYLVMELIEGQSLAARLAGGPLPWPEAVRAGAQVAGALAAAHRIGVVHRDVKPGNVMLTAGGAKVVDFGVAALAGHRSDEGAWLIGTPTYAAPEQLHPAPPEPKSDVYALGVLLYEALTGHPPVRFDTWADAAAFHRAGVPAASHAAGLSGPPGAVVETCIACLAPRPADRPTAERVAGTLAAAVNMPDPAAILRDRTTAVPPVAVGAVPVNPGQPRMAPTTVAPFEDGAGYPPPRDGTRARRLALLALAGAAAVAILAAAIMIATSRPTGPPVTAGPTTAPAPTTAAPTETPTETTEPGSREEVIAQFEQAVSEAAADGTISGDTADELLDKVDGLRDNRGRGNARKRAGDLLEKINDLRDEGEIDGQTADELTGLLRLLGGERTD